ncbi:MAG: hypothetical protein FWD70_03870 [Desulfuromonadales bacterium]|nr:hypothetical protein [Desulfuromonadales bacterium]
MPTGAQIKVDFVATGVSETQSGLDKLSRGFSSVSNSARGASSSLDILKGSNNGAHSSLDLLIRKLNLLSSSLTKAISSFNLFKPTELAKDVTFLATAYNALGAAINSMGGKAASNQKVLAGYQKQLADYLKQLSDYQKQSANSQKQPAQNNNQNSGSSGTDGNNQKSEDPVQASLTSAKKLLEDRMKDLEATENATKKLKAALGNDSNPNACMAEDPFIQEIERMKDRYNQEIEQIQKVLDMEKAANGEKSEDAKRLNEHILGLEQDRLKKSNKAQSNAAQQGWTDVLKSAEKTYPQLSFFDKALSAQIKTSTQENTDSKKDETVSGLAMTSMYCEGVANMFTSMAAAQDQTSRSGFETAKSYNLAAAIMSTASGIMAQFAPPDGHLPSAWARAAIVGVMGAINIAKIASTSFGGGDTSVTPPGSFKGGSAGGVGSKMAGPTTSLRDSQSQDQLQSIANSMENASIAIDKVADGLTKMTDLFKEGSPLTMLMGTLPTQGIDPAGLFSTIMSQSFAGNADGLFRTVTNAIFGGATSVTARGISLGVKGSTVTAQDYEDWKKSGGLFSSDKKWTNYTDNPQVQKTMQYAIDQIAGTINHAVVAMGTSMDWSLVNIAPTKIKTSGRKPEDIQKDFEKWLSSVSNTMAKNVEGLKDFAFVGENAFDALVRLSTSLQGVNEKVYKLGGQLIPATLQGADAAYNLVQLFGNIDKFTSAVDNYFSNMYTDSQQAARKLIDDQRQVNIVFNELGKTMPATREGFQALVNGLDLTTAAGQQAFQALVSISDAAGNIYKTAEDLVKNQRELDQNVISRTLDATGNSNTQTIYDLLVSQEQELQDARDKGLNVTKLLAVQQLEYNKQLADIVKDLEDARVNFANDLQVRALKVTGNTMDSNVADLLSTLIKQEQELADARVNGLDIADLVTVQEAEYNKQLSDIQQAAYDKMIEAQKAYDKALLTDQQTTANNLSNAWKSASDNIGKAIEALKSGDANVDPVTKMLQARNEFNKSALATMGGDAEAAKTLGDLAQKYIDAAKDGASDAYSYQAEYQRVINTLTKAQGLADAKVSEADAQAALLQEQLDALNQSNANAVQAAADALAEAQAQYAATLNLQASVDQQLLIHVSAVDQAHKDALAIVNAIQLAAQGAYSTGILDTSKLPSFALGTSGVPYDMVANIHRNEAIIDSQATSYLQKYGIQIRTSGAADSYNAVISKLDGFERNLIELLKKHRSEEQAENVTNIKHNRKTSETIDKWDKEGLPAEREAEVVNQ